MVSDERLKDILANECASVLDEMVKRTKRINWMNVELRIDGFIEAHYLVDSINCYHHGYFVASIGLTAMLIEHVLKVKLDKMNEKEIENMNFKCVNELCLAYKIIGKPNYENAEFIRKKRNEYVHTNLRKMSWASVEKDALDLINKSRKILEELFPKK